MSQYIYAIIPYKSKIYSDFNMDGESGLCNPLIPELKGVESVFIEPDGLTLSKDFLEINTCHRQSAFANNRDGYSKLRAEICLIAKALEAKEVWYVEELAIDEMYVKDFSFDDWIISLKNEKKRYTAELTTEILKGDYVYSYYHDDFSDIIMEKPLRKNDHHRNKQSGRKEKADENR